MDPWEALFAGSTARDLVAGRAVRVRHGSRRDLPSWTATGPLESVRSLCSSYQGPIEIAGGTAAYGFQGLVPGLAPQAALAAGLTVAFNHLQRQLPDAAPWCQAVERALGVHPGSVALMAFANARGSGLPVHHDRGDQLLLQLEGTKRLIVGEPTVRDPAVQYAPLNSQGMNFGPTYQDGLPPDPSELVGSLTPIELAPGSALFLPAGAWHATADQAEACLTVTVIVRAPTYAELLCTWLQNHLEQAAPWRARPYGAWGPDADARVVELQARMAELSAQLLTLPAGDVFPAWSAAEFARHQVDDPGDHRWDRYVRLPDVSVAWRDAPVGIEVLVRVGSWVVPQSEVVLALPAEARDAIAWIATTRRAFTREDLRAAAPALSEPAGDEILGRLVRARWLRPLLTPPYVGAPGAT